MPEDAHEAMGRELRDIGVGLQFQNKRCDLRSPQRTMARSHEGRTGCERDSVPLAGHEAAAHQTELQLRGRIGGESRGRECVDHQEFCTLVATGAEEVQTGGVWRESSIDVAGEVRALWERTPPVVPGLRRRTSFLVLVLLVALVIPVVIGRRVCVVGTFCVPLLL